MISIFDFSDYRPFLKKKFEEMKAHNPLFSYRAFNRLAGIQSSGFLKLVMDGKRNLAEEGIEKIARGFKLNESEKKYFHSLVRFNQARNNEEKNQRYLELSQHRHYAAAKPILWAQYRLFAHWYYATILELVRLPGEGNKDPRWLQKKLNPPVELKLVKQAVQELIALGLIEKDAESGSLLRREAMLSTPDEVQSLSVALFHQQMSQLAARAVMKENAQDREFSALTIAASKKTFQRAKQEIQRFRSRLHSILEEDRQEPPEFVAHLNFQMFKVSKSGKTNDD
ncbi:MAG TPA: TIGR02147 family protein [bacterium]|nr:TIGR02147 family protein [bacterium]